MGSYTDPVVWGVVLTVGVLTYLLRVSFIALFGYLDDVPPRVERALGYVPAAVLAALVVPSVLALGAGGAGPAVDRLAGGTLATVVAWHTESVFATVAAGMAGLWLVRFVVLPAL